MTDLQALTRLSMCGTEVEARFAFSYKVNLGSPGGTIGDDTRFDRGGSQLLLLGTTPPVGMAQDQLDIVRDGVPSKLSVRLGGLE